MLEFQGQPASSDLTKTKSQDLSMLEQEIALHHKELDSESYLSKFVRVVYQEDARTLDRLESLQKRADSAQKTGDERALSEITREAESAVASDQNALAKQTEVDGYARGFVTSVPLFMKGELGLAGTVLAFGLQEMKPAESAKLRASDFALGGIKGVVDRVALESLGSARWPAPAVGVGLGMVSRFTDTALSRQSYIDSQTGAYDLHTGLTRALDNTTNKSAFQADLAAGALGGLFWAGTHGIGRAAVGNSPVWWHIISGTTYGAASGAVNEVDRELSQGGTLDVKRIVRHGLIQGTLNGIAAAPGGFQTDIMLRSNIRDRMETSISLPVGDRPSLTEAVKQRALDMLSPRAAAPDLNQINVKLRESLTFTDLSPLLLNARTEVETYKAFNDSAEGPFHDASDFYHRGLVDRQRDVRVYDVAGYDTKIVIPESLATRLDKLREYRQAWHQQRVEQGTEREIPQLPVEVGLPFWTPLSENLVAALQELPNPSLVKRLVLENRASPDDVWIQQTDKEFFSGASAEENGDIKLWHEGNATANLGRTVYHEWGHLLHHATPEGNSFAITSELEADGYFQRPYARTNWKENWAVHLGEVTLAPDGKELQELARKAPIRTAIFGSAIKDALENAPPGQQSVFAPHFRARVRYIEEKVLPIAKERLQWYARWGDWNQRTGAKDALELLSGKRPQQ